MKLPRKCRMGLLIAGGVLLWLTGLTAINVAVVMTENQTTSSQATSPQTCPVVQTAEVNQAVGVGSLTAFSRANNCAFMMPSYAALTVHWQQDQHGRLFARSLEAVPSPTFHLTNSIVAADLLKETGLYFDVDGRTYTVVGYGDVQMSSVVAVARLIAT